jgi:pimeloyl-ACP methyl ester carboxylesterase
MRLARYGPSRRLLERLAKPDRIRAQARRNLRVLAAREIDDETLEREAGHAIADPKREVRGYVDLIGHGNPRAPAADVDRYSRIECPVWILRGSEDRDWIPESAEERFRELIPGARVERWEGIGHAPHIQEPRRFAEYLDEFLATASK